MQLLPGGHEPRSIATPLLSILVPAYRYVEGIKRILEGLQLPEIDQYEVLVFDDSPDNQLEQAILTWSATSGICVTYQHNRPAYGAAGNWNALLDAARGEYCLLMHHDEFPLSKYFVRDLVQALRQDVKTDILMLDCVLVTAGGGSCRRHVPMWLRAFVIRHCPNYLFRRNVVGPTATLVIRRSLYPRFDGKLRWLIDVDLYARLLKSTRRLRPCRHVQIGSLLGRADSITADLGSQIAGIDREERAYLQGRHPTAGVWLGLQPGAPVLHGVLRASEVVSWYGMRLATRIAALFYPNPVRMRELRQALNESPKKLSHRN